MRYTTALTSGSLIRLRFILCTVQKTADVNTFGMYSTTAAGGVAYPGKVMIYSLSFFTTIVEATDPNLDHQGGVG